MAKDNLPLQRLSESDPGQIASRPYDTSGHLQIVAPKNDLAISLDRACAFHQRPALGEVAEPDPLRTTR